MEDITERLATIELRAKYLWENSIDPLVCIHPDGYRILTVNGAFVRAFGVGEQHPVGASRDGNPELLPCFLDLLEGEHRERFVRMFTQMIDGVPPVRLRLVFTGGMIGDLSINYPLVRRGVIMSIRDVTDLVNAEAELVKQANLRSLAKLVAGVAHELNTPVGALRSAADVIGRSGSEREAKLAEVVRKATERIESVVRSLAQFARLDEADSALIDLGESIDEVLAVLSIPPSIEVCRDFAPTPKIEARARELNQVWLQLLQNAIAAVGSRGKITISVHEDRGWARIRITDDGAGIDPSLLSSIFEPKFSIKAGRIGMGLGLPIAHRIVAAHGGALAMTSRLNAGTSCEVSLPLTKA